MEKAARDQVKSMKKTHNSFEETHSQTLTSLSSSIKEKEAEIHSLVAQIRDLNQVPIHTHAHLDGDSWMQAQLDLSKSERSSRVDADEARRVCREVQAKYDDACVEIEGLAREVQVAKKDLTEARQIEQDLRTQVGWSGEYGGGV